MRPQLWTISPEVIDCIAQGRPPSEEELVRVADHIRRDLSGSRPAFSWGSAGTDTRDAELTLRAARAALAGDGRAHDGMTPAD
jgi:hypothetical protein